MGAGLIPWTVVGLLLACSPAVAPAPATGPAEVQRGDTLPAPAGELLEGEWTDEHGSRQYRLYVPPGEAAARPLLVLLHGCIQTPADFAAGTRANRWADSLGMVVLYPAQPAEANPNRCWNWYDPAHQRRGAGEPAILAGMTRSVLEDTGADADRVFVAGISAGGVMAETLVAAYPELFGALAVHSAPAYRSASDLPTGFAVLQQGVPDSVDLAGRVLESMGAAARPVPTLVIHGADDPAVRPVNGAQVLRQWAGVALRAGDPADEVLRAGDPTEPGAGAVVTETSNDEVAGDCPAVPGLEATAGPIDDETPLRCVYTGAPVALELWLVEGLGHGWSGGSAEGSFTAPDAPDATARVLEFFLAVEPRP